MATTPNLVLIMADDLGFGDLGMCSFGATATPHIDSLATDGAFLSQHYSASPICAPARAAFLTGRYPQRSGVIDTFPHRLLDRISLCERTMGDLFREAGYRTGIIGKWHSGALGRAYHPNQRGFDEFVGFRGGVQDYWQWRLERDGEAFDADGRYLTDVLSDEAVSFIDRNHEAPFMLLLAYTAPHGPFQAPEDAVAAVRARRSGPSTVDVIAAMVEVMDQGIGRVLQALEEHECSDNTIVMFTSDNGPWMRLGSFDETTVRYNLGLAGGKELVHEGGIRVPMLIRWPGIVERGRTIHDVVHFTDWVPTLLGFVGGSDLVRLPGDGRDVGALLRGGPLIESQPFCWQWSRYQPHPTCNAAIRDGNWKLRFPAVPEILRVLSFDPIEERRLRTDPSTYVPPPNLPAPPPREWTSPAAQLFDLAADPGEQHDLAAYDGARVAQMQHQLMAWFDSVETDRRTLAM